MYGYHRGAATALSGSQQADFGGFRNFTETLGSRNTVPETAKSCFLWVKIGGVVAKLQQSVVLSCIPICESMGIIGAS